MGKETYFSLHFLPESSFLQRCDRCFVTRSDIGVEREERGALCASARIGSRRYSFCVGESGTTYELNLSVSDSPDQTVVISSIAISPLAQAKQARQVPALVSCGQFRYIARSDPMC